MRGAWFEDDIILETGEVVDADLKGITRYAFTVREDCEIYYYGEEGRLKAWIAYMLQGYRPTHTGGRNTFNVLCGTNETIYHVTYTNPGGSKFRVYLFKNLIPYPAFDLKTRFGGDGGADTVMAALHEAFSLGIHGATLASFALQDYRKDMGYARFAEKFPALSMDVVARIRAGYIGGYVMALPGDYGRVTDWDRNAMYATVLHDEFLPFGPPEAYDGRYEPDRRMPRHIDLLTFRADLKEDGYPFLTPQSFAFSRTDDRIVSTHGYVTMPLTDIDQELLMENYDVSIYERVGGWKFRQSKGFFRQWVDKWDGIKEMSKGGRRSLAKGVPNLLIGKFGAVSRPTCLMPELDDDGGLLWRVERYGQSDANVYLPLSMFVNAHARRCLFDAMDRQDGKVIYANTDGFMVEASTCKGLETDANRMGKWKLEGDYRRVRILGPGLYQGEKVDGGYDLISSGISRNTPIPWEEFHEGSVVLDDNGHEVML